MEALNQVNEMWRRMDPNPPLEETYKALFERSSSLSNSSPDDMNLKMGPTDDVAMDDMVMNDLELPLIDLSGMRREDCKKEIVQASMEWGFFRVINHGVSPAILEAMRAEQAKLFREPFLKKQNDAFMNMSPGTYRWGTPTATRLCQLSWSEAFHVRLDEFSSAASVASPRSAVRRFSTSVWALAQDVASMLAEHLGHDSAFFSQNCLPNSCYLRMNRYPPCPKYYSRMLGLMPHTDSDFLTILHEDQVGGLQLLKDGKWVAVNPNPNALIINIGDLFQAWSNGVYKSVEHRVVANEAEERLSTGYFFCPPNDAVIRSCTEPRLYKDFSFKEYRQQVQTDVNTLGRKIGLSRFLLPPTSQSKPTCKCF